MTEQTQLGTFTAQTPTGGFDMDEYEAELDSIVAQVIPGKTDPLAG
jgi:hypothetical protein